MADTFNSDAARNPSGHLSTADLAMWIDVDVQSDAALGEFIDALDADRAIDPSLASRRTLTEQANHLRSCNRCAALTSQSASLTGSIGSTLGAVPTDSERRDRAIAAALAEFDAQHPVTSEQQAPSAPKRFGFFRRPTRINPGSGISDASTSRTSGAKAFLRPSVALTGAIALTAATGVFLASQRSGNTNTAKAADTAASTELVEVASEPVDSTEAAGAIDQAAATEAAAAETLLDGDVATNAAAAAEAAPTLSPEELAKLREASATQPDPTKPTSNDVGAALQSRVQGGPSESVDPSTTRKAPKQKDSTLAKDVLSGDGKVAGGSQKLPAIATTLAPAVTVAPTIPNAAVAAAPEVAKPSTDGLTPIAENLGVLGTFATAQEAIAEAGARARVTTTTAQTKAAPDSGFAKPVDPSLSQCISGAKDVRGYWLLVIDGRDAIALFRGPDIPVVIVDANTCATLA